ncbi:MAG TPA: alpha/beta hydrolase [Gaiellales bacterium]|nr:alpha/beta hydrolase [Gaiellales bacterium]
MHAHTLAVDGLHVNVAEWGAGSPVVLLHGLVGSLDYWAPFAERLARTHRVIALDVPGHGNSEALSDFTFDNVVHVLQSATEQLHAESPAVVGHSFGAPLAVCWAATHRLASMVLASPVGLVHVHARRARMVMPFRGALTRTLGLWESAASSRRLGRRLVFGWFVGMSELDNLEPDTARQMLRGAAKAAPVVGSALPALETLDLERVISGVDTRTLVVWGEHDKSGWANGPGLADALGGEELVLPGVGHMPMIEAPYSFGLAVADFVDEGASPQAGPARLTATRPRR